jgi:tetratricopeptide (TPR) repeat protein
MFTQHFSKGVQAMLRRLFHLFVIAFILTLPANFASAQRPSPNQPVEISGQVRYAQGSVPADEVIVRLDRLSGGVVSEMRTDRLGKFRFSNLSPVQYHLTIRHPGYKEIQREVNLIMSFSEYVQLQLVPDKSAPVTVTGSSKVISANVPAEASKEFEKGEAVLATGKREKLEEGARHFEKAVSIDPKFLEAHLKLGTTYMDLQQWDKAEQVLRQALEINPKTPNALFALGDLYLQQKKYFEAEKVLREGLAVENRSWQGHFTLARVYWDKGDLVNAGRQTAITLQLNPKLAEAHLLAGNILLRARKSEDAQFEFEEYLRLAPKGKYAAQTREVVRKIKEARSARK